MQGLGDYNEKNTFDRALLYLQEYLIKSTKNTPTIARVF